MASQLVDSQRLDGPEGTRVQVLFYADHSIRFRVYRTPMVIEEAFLTGNKQQNTIVKLAPRPSARRGIPDSFRILGMKAHLTGDDGPCRVCALLRGSLYDSADPNVPVLPIEGCEHHRGCTCRYE
jgi:hypothetical protein